MPNPRNNNPVFQFLINLWSKHCPLEDFHVQWAKKHIHIHQNLKKGDQLYWPDDYDKRVLIVTKGLIGRIKENQKSGKRKIITLGTPGMAMMTTKHLFSNTPSAGEIIVLRTGTDIASIKYHHIYQLREMEKNVNTLINIFTNKKKEQLSILRRVDLEETGFDACLQFTKEFPQLFLLLTRQEIADLLSISLRTVQDVVSYLAKNPSR